jgi:predicted nuclease of predicted toxin-antitoxin system
MPHFLIDVNLPYYFSLWRSSDYVHQLDIQNDAEDYAIWQYAKNRNLTIVTKDSDFSDRILLSTPPPKIIHIRTGNMSMRDFYGLISNVWEDVITLSKEYKLVIVFKDKLEAVN